MISRLQILFITLNLFGGSIFAEVNEGPAARTISENIIGLKKYITNHRKITEGTKKKKKFRYLKNGKLNLPRLSNNTDQIRGEVQRRLGRWAQIGGNLVGSSYGHQFGYSISVNGIGNIMAAGAPGGDGNGSLKGSVRIFKFQAGNWVQYGQQLDGLNNGDEFGSAVSLSNDGTVLAVGARRSDSNGFDSGNVCVFKYNGYQWIKIGGELQGWDAYSSFGSSIALSKDGSVVAVGGPENSVAGTLSGYVQVYYFNGAYWMQLGNNLHGQLPLDFFGGAVALNDDGNILAVGSPGSNINGAESGQVRVFKWQGIAWSQIGSTIPGLSVGSLCGSSVGLNGRGNVLVVGSRGSDKRGVDSGNVRVFGFKAGDWKQIGSSIPGEQDFDRFGSSVAVTKDGRSFIAGGTGNGGKGYVSVYNFNDQKVWSKVSRIMGSDTGDDFGSAVAMSESGQFIAIGGPRAGLNGGSSGQIIMFKYVGGGNNQYMPESESESESEDEDDDSCCCCCGGPISAVTSRLPFGRGACGDCECECCEDESESESESEDRSEDDDRRKLLNGRKLNKMMNKFQSKHKHLLPIP